MGRNSFNRKLKLKEQRTYLEGIANTITEYVKSFGIHVLRYDAITTESIYLKFDYGMSGSLRISAHNGKKDLRYTFNILKDLESPYIEKNIASNGSDISMYFYPDYLYKNVAIDIVRYKDYRMQKYGNRKYIECCNDKQKMLGKGNKFWAKCREV